MLTFRHCVVPAPGKIFWELDYSAIEAVLTGWFSGDAEYIRLAKLGVHAYLTSHIVNKPANLSWPDDKLKSYFAEMKKEHFPEYNRAKRCIHGTNYGLTPFGMVRNYPGLFTQKSATALQDLYFTLCPKLKAWQENVREIAHKQHYLGGNDHPFHYKHWFWDVYSYGGVKDAVGMDGATRRVVINRPGADYKRVVAYYPQSTAAGVIKDAALRFARWEREEGIAEGYADTTIRALIHDSILLEVPENNPAIATMLGIIMRAPVRQLPIPKEWGMGEFLSFGVSVKKGTNWHDMEEVSEKDIASDTPNEDLDEDEEEDV